MLKKGFGPILSHPVIIINIITAKAGESSCVALFTKTVAQEPATSCAGTWFLHHRSWFLRGTFHKDCGAGTSNLLCWNHGSSTTSWGSSVARFTKTAALEPVFGEPGESSSIARLLRTVALEPVT